MKGLRVGIAALVAASVLAFGGVEQSAQALLELSAAVLFLIWGIRASRVRHLSIESNVLFWPLGSLCGVAVTQLVLGRSASAYLTQLELLKWAGCWLLMFLFIQSFRSASAFENFLWFLSGLGFFMALFGIIQSYTWNGKLYWLVPLPEGAGPFGPFVNRDHFAGFVELTALPGLAVLLHRALEPEKLALLGVMTMAPVGALFLSASRGGIVAFLFACCLLLLLTRGEQIGKSRWLGLVIFAALAGAFIVWLGMSDTFERFGQLKAEGISRDRRVSMYRDTWKIIEHCPWMGTGLGTLVAVYPGFESQYDGRIVDHAHNDYLELLADTGLVGGVCGLAFLVLLTRGGLANWRKSGDPRVHAMQSGALAGCGGVLLHSLVEFNLHIPSNGLLFLLLTAIATMRVDGEAGEP